jgi:hypothetical protein
MNGSPTSAFFNALGEGVRAYSAYALAQAQRADARALAIAQAQSQAQAQADAGRASPGMSLPPWVLPAAVVGLAAVLILRR